MDTVLTLAWWVSRLARFIHSLIIDRLSLFSMVYNECNENI